MAFDETNGSGIPATMLVGPTGYGNGGFGNGFGGDWAWIIILLLAFNGGFGGWGGMGGFGGYGNMMLGYDFPWLLNGQQGINNNVSGGFRDAQLNDSITSVRDGISSLSTQICGCCGDISTQLCNGFSGVTASVTGAQNALAQQMYANQIADLERSFAAQTATMQGFNGTTSGLADLKYTVATENCADRTAAQQNTRDIIEAQTRGTQAILDKLCSLELDAKNDTIAQLRQEVLFARGQASQIDQTSRLLAGQASEVDALYTRLSNCPVPSVPVYGRQPIFQCGNATGCGCGVA